MRENNHIQLHLSSYTSKNPLGFSKYEEDINSFYEEWNSGRDFFEIPTSGSTGKPKIIRISKEQMVISAENTVNYLGLKEGDKALVCLNTRYIAGLMMLVRGLISNMELIVVPPVSNPLKQFSSDAVFDFSAMVPYQLSAIFRESPEKVGIINRMKALLLGGAAIDPVLERRIRKRITAPVYHTYGMTETVSHIALRRINGTEPTDIFTIIPGVEIDIDERGCLVVSGPVTNHEKMITNDRVDLVSDSQFRWLGRVDNIINSGGVKVQTEKVEKALQEVLGKLDMNIRIFVCGMPQEDLGETVVAVLESTPVHKEKEDFIRAELQKKLSKYEVPRFFRYIKKFNETSTGKIDRKKSRSLMIS